MAVTSQQIAELAGVSRGTVDRALHNRGRVSPEVAVRFLEIAEELRVSGVEVELREVQGRDTVQVLRQIDELVASGANGLAIAAGSAPELVRRIDELSKENIPVVTFNTDAPDSKRLCFVGMDNDRAGQTAAGLIRQMLPNGGVVLPRRARQQ